jgi:Putative SAM-dependent methyltransferase
MMNDFDGALRKLHIAGNKRFGDEWIPRLKRRRVILESAYATLYEQDRDPISYAPLSAQAAYVFAYAPARAEYTRQYLHRHRAAIVSPLFGGPHARVVSFGGGPASELVGLVRYLEEANEPVENINYIIYDKDGDWNDVATGIVNALKTDIVIQMGYEEVDASSRARMAGIDLSKADLVIFSYVMSELAKLDRKDQIAQNFRATLGNMKVNSKILFIDSLHPIFIKYFQSCKLVSGLNQRNDDDTPVNCDFSDMNGTFETLSEALEWVPRTELRSVSKLIVRTSM